MIGLTSTIKTSLEKQYGADQKVRIEIIAHDALTKLTPYKVTFNEFGHVTAALADDQHYYYVGIPEAALASGDRGVVVIGGPMGDVVTPSLSVSVGHAFKIYDGAVADVGADYTGVAGEFAICQTVSTSSTTQDMLLVPKLIIGTT